MTDPTPHPSTATAARPLRYRKTAVLVIHGIGEQNPYETLDSFGRGIFSYLLHRFGANELRLEPKEIAHDDWTQVFMRIRWARGEARAVDIYEYYWAPYAEGQLSPLQTIAWLLRTDLTPLRYLASNLQEMAGAGGRAGRKRVLLLFGREIRRIVLLYVPLALVLLGILRWLTPQGPLPGALTFLTRLQKLVSSWSSLLSLVFYALAILMAVFLFQTVADWARRSTPSIQRRAEAVWFASAVVSAAGFFFLARGLAGGLGTELDATLERLNNFLVQLLSARSLTAKQIGGGIVATLAAFLSYFLMKYVADVAVYVNSDAKSKNYEARRKILEGANQALSRILADPDYDAVILAGHSLGSVIAYDLLNELRIEVAAGSRAGSPHEPPRLSLQQLNKLTGLVTFGSPLDKVYYFFRQHVRPDQAIRAQILSMLYSFRKHASYRDYGQFKFLYALPGLENIVWLNAWSPLDPVSNYLRFYDVDDQRCFWYRLPVLAHLSYWRDPAFFEFWGDRLL